MFKLFLCFPFFCLWHICAAPQAWIYTDKHLLSRLNRVLEAVGRIIPRSLRLLLLRGLGGVKNFVQKPFFMVAPASYFSKLEKIKVDEILVNIPSDSKKYLEHKYGKNWRIPNKSWIWWEDDQGICKDDKILDEFLVSLKYYQGWKPYTRKANR